MACSNVIFGLKTMICKMENDLREMKEQLKIIEQQEQEKKELEIPVLTPYYKERCNTVKEQIDKQLSKKTLSSNPEVTVKTWLSEQEEKNKTIICVDIYTLNKFMEHYSNEYSFKEIKETSSKCYYEKGKFTTHTTDCGCFDVTYIYGYIVSPK